MSKAIKKNCLVYCISPTHLLSSISAVKTLHRNENIHVDILVHHPYVSANITSQIGLVIKDMSRLFKFIKKIIVISENKFSRNTDNLKELGFRKSYDEIYYYVDFIGKPKLLFEKYPSAQKICYGDAFGIVYEEKVHLSFLNQKKIPLVDKVIAKIRHERSFVTEYSETIEPDLAVLILPVDQSGNFLKNVALTIVSKKKLIETIDQCIYATSKLQKYLKTTLNNYQDRNKTLLLTENYAEGNFIDFDKEIEMWCSIVRENCKKGEIIFIKPHPGETLERFTIIKRKLKDYKVVLLDKEFHRYPIEIFKELVLNCDVICMSYPMLSLKYLYNLDVINPMNKKFIRRWFPRWTWASYENSISLYMEPLKKLATWDGKSILWTRK